MDWRVWTVAVVTLSTWCSADGSDTLYSNRDGIVQMTVDTFDRTMIRSPTGWVVEFYATWCGHCQRFAPVYKEFAKSVADWNKVIRVGSVECSDSRNLPVCRRQNIWGYPTVKFFPPNMQSVGRGVKENLRFSVASLKDSTLRFVEDHVMRRGGPYPYLRRYESLLKLLDDARAKGTERLFAIIEDDGLSSKEKLAKLVIMDMSSSYPTVMIGRLHRSAVISYEMADHRLPSLMQVNMHTGRMRFVSTLTNEDEVKRRIEALSSQSWIPDHPATTPHPDEYDQADRVTTPPAPRVPQKLTPADLESNIHYMLWNEVASRSKIRGHALIALKTYVQVLAKYFPGEGRLKSFLEIVTSWLGRINGSVDGVLYINTIDGLQTNDSYVSKELKWQACAGTEEKFRGYPCSLWMTFHALTVSAYEHHLEHPEEPFDPMEVLGAIRGYVRYYLGCRECAEHFQKMARLMEEEVHAPEDVILWMWRGHNRANNRLHGDPTEDPAYPKMQFPCPILCPTCRRGYGPIDVFDNHTDWNVPEVLKFLRYFYSKENFHRYLSTTMAVPRRWPTVAPYLGTNGRSSSHGGRQSDDTSSLYGGHQSDQSDDVTPPPPTTTPTPTPAIRVTTRREAARPSGRPANGTCRVRTTPWSPCTTSCDPGVSTRLSNANDQCEMRLEMRICQIRPCDFDPADYRIRRARPGQCAANMRSVDYANLVFGGCTTVQAYRWRFCNQCPGHCCEPVNEGTFWADVICRHGDQMESGMVRMGWIINCQCRPGNC